MHIQIKDSLINEDNSKLYIREILNTDTIKFKQSWFSADQSWCWRSTLLKFYCNFN